MSQQLVEYYKALHYNSAKEGFDYYQTLALTNKYQLITYPGFLAAYSKYHNVSDIDLIVGNKVPVFGANAARWGTHIINAPYNMNYNVLYHGSSVDDNYTGGGNLPFSFFIGGSGYTNIYTGTNTYFTFGSGSDEYEDLSENNPNIPKIFLGSADHSYQRVWDKISTECYRVRYEGAGSSSGIEGNPTIVIEATFCNPALFGGRNVCEILVGVHNATTDINMIASADTQLCFNPPSLEENTSYVMIGNSDGQYWTVLKNRYLKNPPYSY